MIYNMLPFRIKLLLDKDCDLMPCVYFRIDGQDKTFNIDFLFFGVSVEYIGFKQEVIIW